MLGRLLVVDDSCTSRYAMKARLSAANHDVICLGSTEEVQARSDIAAVIYNVASQPRFSADLTRLRSRLRCPIIALAVGEDRRAAFEAGADRVLDPACSDSVLRARLRSWVSLPAVSEESGFSEAGPSFDIDHQILLVTSDTALAREWSLAIQATGNCRASVLSPQAALARCPEGYSTILVDGEDSGTGLQYLVDLRARMAARERCAALALLQRDQDGEEEARALDSGATEVFPASLHESQYAAELAARLGWLCRRGAEAERQLRETRLARNLASRDPLTGLANRRQIDAAVGSALGQPSPVGLMMIDIDHFKAVNDGHGHAAGDCVLQMVAQKIRNVVGCRGEVGRYGGEEFLAVLHGVSEPEAVVIAEKIRRDVSETPFRVPAIIGDPEISVTLSIGVAHVESCVGGCAACGEGMREGRARGECLAQALRAADHALLRAKAAGRNLVMIGRVSRQPSAPLDTRPAKAS